MTFKARLTKPERGNKFYITKAKGGYSTCVQGKPVDKDCDVLANCVGYASGRFNEIIGSYKYTTLNCNAENFVARAKAASLVVGQTPKLGAIMCWQKGATLNGSDGAGHVAVVEQIINNNEVITSESGYNASKPFWTQRRVKGTGVWGQSNAYKFLGFIYNPAVKDEPKLVVDNKRAKIMRWQNLAIADGYKFPKAGADGYWGSECESVAKKAVCKRGKKSYNLTKWVQEIVGCTVDGSFGPNTEKTVKVWQKKNGLSQDGCFGPTCIKKALGVYYVCVKNCSCRNFTEDAWA